MLTVNTVINYIITLLRLYLNQKEKSERFILKIEIVENFQFFDNVLQFLNNLNVKIMTTKRLTRKKCQWNKININNRVILVFLLALCII